jgi:ubiquitin-protein ligase
MGRETVHMKADPMSPPEVKFVTRIYHPNVSNGGDICVDILENKWSSAYTISQLMLSITDRSEYRFTFESIECSLIPK